MAFNRFAKHERRKKGERNKLEASYESYLETLKRAGEIDDYQFEGMTLKIADNCRYTADFVVFSRDGVVELHDTKGTTTKKLTNGDKVKKPWIEGAAIS